MSRTVESVGQGQGQSQFTLDALVTIFGSTFGSLKGSWGLLFATLVATGYDIHNSKLHFALGWAVLVTIVWSLAWLNRYWVSRGPAKLEPGQLVVITGASSGLGLYLAASLSRTNPILALDIKPPALAIANTQFVTVDCASEKKISEAIASAVGDRTVHALVNCVGIARGGSTADLDPRDITTTVATNFLGPVWATRAILKVMPVGHIVNISSSTGYVGPCNAGIYAASKAALRIWHQALRQEVPPSIKTILVVPGQLDTPMFSAVRTPSQFCAPVIRGTDLGDEIMRWLLNGWAGEIISPLYARLLPIALSAPPQSIVDLLRWLSGVDRAMNDWKQ